MKTPLLSIKNLSIVFNDGEMTVNAVQNASLELSKGETLALVGESGSGKSVTAFSIMRLLPKSASYLKGDIIFEGKKIINMSEKMKIVSSNYNIFMCTN